MEQNEFDRFLTGLIKKHGETFSLDIKYQTNSGKKRKRSGTFQGIEEGNILVLYNPMKKSSGRYEIARIEDISKGTSSSSL